MSDESGARVRVDLFRLAQLIGQDAEHDLAGAAEGGVQDTPRSLISSLATQDIADH